MQVDYKSVDVSIAREVRTINYARFSDQDRAIANGDDNWISYYIDDDVYERGTQKEVIKFIHDKIDEEVGPEETCAHCSETLEDCGCFCVHNNFIESCSTCGKAVNTRGGR